LDKYFLPIFASLASVAYITALESEHIMILFGSQKDEKNAN
jgi:hypothetical protein